MNHSSQTISASYFGKPKTFFISGLLLLGAIIILSFISFISRDTTDATITSYLHAKYGSEINFIDTGEGGGGGVDINHYYALYTTPSLNDRKFRVTYLKDKKNHKTTVLCDGYTEAYFADEIENLFANIIHDFGYDQFIVRTNNPSNCSETTPTDDLHEYLRNEKSRIFAVVTMQDNPTLPIDKAKLAETFATRMKELGLPQKADSANQTFARFEIVDDQCSYLDYNHCPRSHYTEYFWLTLDGYEDISL